MRESIKDFLDYDPKSGNFVWKVTRNARQARVGDIAGRFDSYGYVQIRFKGKSYLAHRLAWFFYYGEFPDGELDHINGNRNDNSIANLRLATRRENTRNTRMRKDNTSGFKGVTFHKKTGKWAAALFINGKTKHLGLFETALLASKEYCRRASELHGEFFNPGLLKG